MRSFDYVIVGSGIAGLYAALMAREHGSVLVLTKGSIDECNTKYAQGGIAAAVGPDDSAGLHFEDTIEAGAGLVDSEAAQILTSEAADRIADLVHFGVPFDSVDGEVALGREGAHSRARILHAGGDSTGAHIELTLSEVAKHSRVTILEHSLALDIRVEDGAATGVLALDTRTNTVEEFGAKNLILATGGCGQLYRFSTNPPVATADGVAVAYRAGAEIIDMEFIQFHPTALRLPGVPVFLISEAVRGEGGHADQRRRQALHARLRRPGGAGPARHRRPGDRQRDDAHRERPGLPGHHAPAGRAHGRALPANSALLRASTAWTSRSEPIPVSPAAHYMMGGVRTNSWGETNIANLYACGEVACTGVHGANRLASNSLLETVVFAKRIVARTLAGDGGPTAPSRDAVRLPDSAEAGLKAGIYRPEGAAMPRIGAPARALPFAEAALSLANLQSLMWDKVGIVRDGPGLAEAALTLSMWERSAAVASDRPSHELRNLLLTGRLVTEAALIRQESRGAHYRTDFPHAEDSWRRHIIFQNDA